MKNKLLFFVFFLLGMLLHGQLEAQTPSVRSKEIKTIGNKEYYMHHVKQGETLWGLSKAYRVTVEEIEELNPEVKKGLKAGHVIGIPVRPESGKKEESNPTQVEVAVSEPDPEPEESVDEEPFVEVQPEPELVVEKPKPVVVKPVQTPNPDNNVHVVKQGEDLYDIAKKYGIDLADFRAVNKGLSDEPAVGTRIVIPNIANDKDYIVHSCEGMSV